MDFKESQKFYNAGYKAGRRAMADEIWSLIEPIVVPIDSIATCDICGQSDDHKHDASEYDVDGLERAMYEGEHDL